MNIDVHAHYVPAQSLKMAGEIGARHGLKLEKSAHGREFVTRDGKALKAEFSDLDLRLAIMDGQGMDMQGSAVAKLSKPPSESIKLLYFDTIAHSQMALEYLVENFGANQVLLGSDCPYDMGEPEPRAALRAARLSAAQIEQVAGVNACKLLRIGI